MNSGLFGAATLLSGGDTPCYSLTKTEQRQETVEGIKSTYIIASASNYGSEGYLNANDVEEALKSIFAKLR